MLFENLIISRLSLLKIKNRFILRLNLLQFLVKFLLSLRKLLFILLDQVHIRRSSPSSRHFRDIKLNIVRLKLFSHGLGSQREIVSLLLSLFKLFVLLVQE